MVPTTDPFRSLTLAVLLAANPSMCNQYGAETGPLCHHNMKHAMTGHLYLEDLQVGQRFVSATHLMEESRIKAFAEEFDPQPFHLDESAAQASLFRGLAASGWHTAAVAMRLLVTSGLPLANGIIGLSGEIAWPKPTRPGDTLLVESEIVEISPSRSKPNQGIVTVRSTTLNQNGEPVYVFTSRILVFRLTPGNPAA
jgi:acyl dehydratase